MVPRYSRKEMVDIWSDDSKYSIWLDIEVYALEGMELVGIVPKGTASACLLYTSPSPRDS